MSELPPALDDLAREAELIAIVRDGSRYRRLRILGCAPAETSHLEQGLVLRFTNLDEFVDADFVAHPSRGDT